MGSRWAWPRRPEQHYASQTRPQVIFRTIGWPGFKNVSGLFLEETKICKPSARDERGGVPEQPTGARLGRGGRSCARAELGWMGPHAQWCRNHPRAANCFPREGETTRQRVPKPLGGERSPRLGTGWLPGIRRRWIANYFLFVLVNPKFAVHLSVKLFQEGSLGPAPASRVLPKVDVWVVPGLPPSLRAPSFAPNVCCRVNPGSPGLCHPTFIDS